MLWENVSFWRRFSCATVTERVSFQMSERPWTRHHRWLFLPQVCFWSPTCWSCSLEESPSSSWRSRLVSSWKREASTSGTSRRCLKVQYATKWEFTFTKTKHFSRTLTTFTLFFKWNFIIPPLQRSLWNIWPVNLTMIVGSFLAVYQCVGFCFFFITIIRFDQIINSTANHCIVIFFSE